MEENDRPLNDPIGFLTQISNPYQGIDVQFVFNSFINRCIHSGMDNTINWLIVLYLHFNL